MRKILHSVATAGEIQAQHSFKLVSDFVTIDNTLTVRKIVFQKCTSHWTLINASFLSLKGENLPWPTSSDKTNELGAEV